MKKVYLVFSALLFASVGFAQQPLNQNNARQQFEPLPAPESRDFLKTVTTGPEDQFSTWYYLGTIMEDEILTSDYSYFRNYLMPDTNVVLEFNTGYGSVWKHSFGMNLDPTSSWFGLSSQYPSRALRDTTSYVVDSVGFFYRYARFQTANPDTVRIQVVQDNDIFVNNFGTDNRPYARINYDTTLRRNPDAFLDTTIILTDADTSFVNQQFLQIPVNHTVSGGGRVAATITYYPGNPYSLGDTIDAYLTNPPVNRINPFIVFEYADNNKTIDFDSYLNGLQVTSDIRYNQSTNGWNEDYIPANAWASRFYYLDMAFKLTTLDYDDGLAPAGIVAKDSPLNSATVFPNPTNGTNSMLKVNMKQNEMVSISLFNLIGQELMQKSVIAQEGESNIELPTANLKSGIYFARVSTNGFNNTIKITVD